MRNSQVSHRESIFKRRPWLFAVVVAMLSLIACEAIYGLPYALGTSALFSGLWADQTLRWEDVRVGRRILVTAVVVVLFTAFRVLRSRAEHFGWASIQFGAELGLFVCAALFLLAAGLELPKRGCAD